MMRECWACDTVQEFIEKEGLPVRCVMGYQIMNNRLPNPCTGMFNLKDETGRWITNGMRQRVTIGPFATMPVLWTPPYGPGSFLEDLDRIKAYLAAKYEIKNSNILVAKSMAGV